MIRWRQLPGTMRDVEQAARDVAETVLGHIQRRLDAPVVLSATGTRSPTAQSEAPLSYVEARERFAGLEWIDGSGRNVRIVTDFGRELEAKSGRRQRRRPIVGGVGSSQPKRRPARVNVRPGRGGLQPRRLEDTIDLTRGIEAYGEAIWWSGSGGATLGLIELNPEGNTVLWNRLSGDDGEETLDGQMKPNMGLANRVDELVPRYALCAIDMQGWRDVKVAADGPLEPDAIVRDDLLQLERWINEGWLEHVVLRDHRRLARDTLPGDQIIRFLERNRIGLWFTDMGRRVDYVTDRAMLRFFNVIAAEDRDNTTRQLQMARVNKGPMIGKGWGPLKFGFYRDRTGWPLQDAEQWPWILRMFEIADVLGSDDPGAFSIRKVRTRLEEEGCPFSNAHVARILADKIYVTGEYAVTVRGVEVAQEPIGLENPVPISRYLRVQELLALRQGKSTSTAIGECLLNSVEALHKRCMEENERAGKPIRIKAYRMKHLAPDVLNYRHYNAPAPACCRSGGRNHRGGYTWPRDSIDRPLVEAIRELATHPEVLRQAAIAARHTDAPSSARLTAGQREQLEREKTVLQDQLDRLADEWVAGASRRDGQIDLEGYSRISKSLSRKLSALQTRLDNDELAATVESEVAVSGERDRVRTFLEIMTVETPEDPLLRQLRARIFQRIVQRVIIDDDGDGPITLTIEGHLVPEGAPLAAANPVLACADLLDAFKATKRGELPVAEAKLEKEAELRADFETVSEKPYAETVSQFYSDIPSMTTSDELARLEESTLAYSGWQKRWAHSRRSGVTSWRMTRIAEPADYFELWRQKLAKTWLQAPFYAELVSALESEGGETSSRVLCSTLGWTRRTLTRRVQKLIDDGQVERVNGGSGSKRMTYRLVRAAAVPR